MEHSVALGGYQDIILSVYIEIFPQRIHYPYIERTFFFHLMPE